jgi:hypothetical protein
MGDVLFPIVGVGLRFEKANGRIDLTLNEIH